MIDPSYDLSTCAISDVDALCRAYHGYGGASSVAVVCYAVREAQRIVAAYAWQPPPPGAAKSVCPQQPSAVLALSRMVATPRDQRTLRHVSTPLRRQMRVLLDRGRWPVLVTYSDEGQGHTGHVYRCSGWTPTLRSRADVYENASGQRASNYSRGRSGGRDLTRVGHTWIQRWEQWSCAPEEVPAWMESHGWMREPIVGKVWRSGNQAYTWRKR